MRHAGERNSKLQIIIAAVSIALFAGSAAGESWPSRSPDSRDSRPTRLRTMELRRSDSRLPSTLPWNEAVQQSSTPEDISKAVKNRVQYSRDMFKEDEWRSGRDTWDKGEGDCEDYAAAVKDLCADKGFAAQILVVRSKTARAAHAVTIGEVNGRVWVSSNGSYKEYQSLYDAKQELARDLGWYAPEVEMFTVEQSGTDGC